MTRTQNHIAVTAVEAVVRHHWARVLASLVGLVRDFQLAEDALQDACVTALTVWPGRGTPDRPDAWLLQAARRKAIDRIRRDRNFATKRDQLAVLNALEQQGAGIDGPDGDTDEANMPIPDERLSLIFTCCHPALASDARVALTLRTIGGLKTAEIARGFLVPEPTMAQRLVRAKNKIRAAGIPYRVPPPELWRERLSSVLSVLYLIFNEGYAATSGAAPARTDLCLEAIRLARILHELISDEPETAGLLALMLLHDARRPARSQADGTFVSLEDQDRRLYNRGKIEEGDRLLRRTLATGRVGPYQLQAAISALHATAPSYDETDWEEIRLVYDTLYRLQPSPVVQLNAAVALGNARGWQAGLAAVREAGRGGGLDTYQPYHAACAEFLARAGQHAEAVIAYRRAIELTENQAEQAFLSRRLAALDTTDDRTVYN